MKKLLCAFLFVSLSSLAAIWTIGSFERHCVEAFDGEMVHNLSESGRTVKCMLDGKEVSSAFFDKKNQMMGYDQFKRQGDLVLKREIYNSQGKFDNQEIYLPYDKESTLVYFRIDSSGKIIDGHYMIPPEMIKIIPMNSMDGSKSLIAVANGKQVSVEEALEKIKKLVVKTYKKDLAKVDTDKKSFSELILELNKKQLSESIGNQPATKEAKPTSSK